MTQQNILIVESNPLVALDLTQTVSPHVSDAKAIVATSLREAETHLETVRRFAVVLLNATREEMKESNIVARIRQVSDAIIVLDSFAAEAIELIDDHVVVRRPFSAEMLERAIDMAGQRVTPGQ